MINDIQNSAAKKILFLQHSVQQMSRPDRMISPKEVEQTVLHGEIIEEYQGDPRGRSCLMLHKPSGRAIHVVCAPKEDYLSIITAYLPHPDQWDVELKKRRE